MKSPLATFLLVISAGLGLTLPGPEARSAPAPALQDGSVEVALPADGTLADFLAEYARATGERVVFDPRWIEGQRIAGVGALRLPRDRAGAALRSILRSQGWVLMPVGGSDLELRTLHRIDAMHRFRENAVHVALDDLLAGKVEDALIVTALVPLRHTDANAARNSLNGMFVDQLRGHVAAIPGANALVVTNFADTVRSLAAVMLEADRLAGERRGEPGEGGD